MSDWAAQAAGDLFQSAPCGYLITKDDTTITAVNDTFLVWSGHAREQLIGRKLTALLPADDRALYITYCQPLLAMTGAVNEIALDILNYSGEQRAALLTANRSHGTTTGEPVVRVVILGSYEQQFHERALLAAGRAAATSPTGRADAETRLTHLAQHDPMTGLLNRVGLTALLHRLFLTPPIDRSRPALLFVDIDHFSSINNCLGHSAGDELIVVVAQRLRAALRHLSTLARPSGDEFVIVENVTDTAELIVLAERLLERVHVPVSIDGVDVMPSVSIGLAVAGPADTVNELFRNAETAMHRAKSAGRNTWQLHDPLTLDPTVDRLRIIDELREGIGRGELQVHYQPRVDVATGRVHGAEALVRWQHPIRGLLTPDAFIDIAEKSGLIHELGARVLDDAIAQVTSWNRARANCPPLEIAVNLSARQLADPTMVDVVVDALSRHDLEPWLLTLEITETALMINPDEALRALTALRALGVVLAIDDFGTGYSSLTYLKRFPVQELKIDRSFVAGLGIDTGDTAIVASCIQLAHAVGIRAVAEGVETVAQQQALVALHCDLAQGYFLGRPVPPERFPVTGPTGVPGPAA
ncbi:EAL domain-containing protein [Nakamurella deserti]|uniref:sensor domain-containing protein n=1 Tax=Nakamurella deserti TaxID=2164074 RepID=UPI00197CA03E|nr:EAL domain-containing protein [Nakamurella deserti]